MADGGDGPTAGTSFFPAYRKAVDAALDELLPPETTEPESLHRAMRYSVFAGGKRLRPVLVLAAADACGATAQNAMPAACAVELIHAYSLIHDDLPAFDDDELRRGMPTNHKVYGEAVAILAGDALQAAAFGALSGAAARADDPLPWVQAGVELATAAGSTGMAGGQCIDIESEGIAITRHELEALHAAKTGALLTACVRIGGLLGGADTAGLDSLTAYGRAVGLAFQVVDDLLDVEGSVEALGKTPGADAARDKPTYPALLGLDAARSRAEELRRTATTALEPFGEQADALRTIADFIVERSR